MREPDFSASPEDAEVIVAIVRRVGDRHRQRVLSEPFDATTLLMDLHAVHNTNPLRLADLLEAPDKDFFHDVYGIQQHIDRRNGYLRDCFLPRYTNMEAVRA